MIDVQTTGPHASPSLLPPVPGDGDERGPSAFESSIALEPRSAHPVPGVGELQIALDLVQDAVFFVDSDLRIQCANSAAARLIGIRKEDLPGRPLRAYLPSRRVGDRFDSAAARTCCRHADGRRIPITLEVCRLNGSVDVLAIVCRDRRPLRRLARLARRPAGCDTLTGLPNRAVYRARLEIALAQHRPDAAPFAVLFIDLDRFKQVNDTLGHRAGDVVLTVVGRRLSRCLREDDLVARYGGDEFVAFIDAVPSLAKVERVARRMQSAIERPIEVDGQTISISATVGICWNPPPEFTVDDVLDAADRDLYQAKDARSPHYAASRPSEPE